MNDYETAVRALKHAVDHPDAFSADDIETLTEIVKAGKPAPERAADLGEGGSMFGPTGIDVGSPAEAQLGATREKFEGEERARQEHPGIVKALEQSGLPHGMPVPEAISKGQRGRIESEHYDPGLRSASQRKDMYADPVFMAPPKPPAAPSPGLVPSFGMPWVGHSAAMPETPTPRSYYEPSVDKFHAQLAPVYGEKVYSMGSSSPEYKEWADLQWKQARAEAEQKGESIIRHEYANPHDSPEYKGRETAHHVSDLARGMAHGFAGPLAGAAGIEEPGSGGFGLAGELGGAYFNPFFRAAEAAIPVKGAVSGAVAGALGMGGMSAAGKLADENRGSLSETATDVAKDALLGGALGGVGGLFSGGLARQGEKLRRETNLGELERGGYAKPSMVSGIKPTEKITEAENLARERGFVDARSGKPLVVEREALTLEKPFVEEARARQASGKEFGSQAEREIYEANKRLRVSAKPIVDALEEAKQARLDREGRPRTSVAAREIRAIDREIQNYIDPELSDMAGQPIARLYDPKEIDGVIKDIQAMDPKALARGAPTGRQPLPDFEKIKAAAHALRDQIPGGTEFVPAGLESTIVDDLGKKRTLRDYSAFKHESAKDIQAGARQRGMMGLPEGQVPETLSASESTKLQSTLRRYGDEGQHEADEAIRDFAKATGKTPSLDLMRAYKAYEALREQAKVMGRLRRGGLPSRESLSGKSVALRLDPALRALAPKVGRLGAFGALAGEKARPLVPRFAGMFGSELNGPEEPLTLDEVNQALATQGTRP